MATDRSARRATVIALALSTSLTACGGTMAFRDNITVSIAQPKPAKPKKPRMVEITLDHVEIKDKILFEIDKAVIRPESFGLLDEVVEVLQENPRVKRVKIIGHTDNDGEESYNQQLSERRAASVRAYLVEHGIPKERLESEGRGESEPLVSNDTFAGREKNRRVEFLITEQDTTAKVPAEQAAKASKAENKKGAQ